MSFSENLTEEILKRCFGKTYQDMGVVIDGVARNMRANELPKGHWGKIVDYSQEDIIKGYIFQFTESILRTMVERSEGELDPENLMFLGSERFMEVERRHFSKKLRKHFFNFSVN